MTEWPCGVLCKLFLASGLAWTRASRNQHGALNALQQQLDCNHGEYLHPPDCASRGQEVKKQRYRSKGRKPNAQGVVVEKVTRTAVTCDASTIHILDAALRRRGMCYHTKGLVNVEAHERIRTRLIKAVSKKPARTDWSPPSVEDALEVDRKIFFRLHKACARGIRIRPGGVFPLDEVLPAMFENYEVAMLIAPKVGRPTPLAHKQGKKQKLDPLQKAVNDYKSWVGRQKSNGKWEGQGKTSCNKRRFWGQPRRQQKGKRKGKGKSKLTATVKAKERQKQRQRQIIEIDKASTKTNAKNDSSE